MTSGKLFEFSLPQFPHLCKKIHNSTHPFFQELDELLCGNQLVMPARWYALDKGSYLWVRW